jgi:hypothetical protein
MGRAFEIQYQILATSVLSAEVLQSCNIFPIRFFGEKIPPRRHG